MTNLATRGIWLAIALLLAVVTGTFGGILAWIGGDNPAHAIIAGAATFAGTATLSILAISFVMSTHRR
jgi:hypothetical protein